MMRVADRDGQRVGGIGAGDLDPGKLQAHHVVDLRLGGMSHAHHGLFHRIGRVFSDHQPGLRRHQKGYSARLTQLQRGHRVLVDEGMLHRRGIGGIAAHHFGQLRMERDQPLRQFAVLRVRVADAIGDMRQPRPVHVDHPPAEVPQARINPENPHR